LKFKRRQRSLEVGAVILAKITRLRDRGYERSNRRFVVCEFRRTDQVLLRAELFGQMMEHERPATEPVSPHFKARTKSREWIPARRPIARSGAAGPRQLLGAGIRRQSFIMSFVVIEDDFKEPVRL